MDSVKIVNVKATYKNGEWHCMLFFSDSNIGVGDGALFWDACVAAIHSEGYEFAEFACVEVIE